MRQVYTAEGGELKPRGSGVKAKPRGNVFIFCSDEKRPREHKFSRPEAVQAAGSIQYWKLMFSCCVCEAERVYGTEVV
jgi:hypothetical protein